MTVGQGRVRPLWDPSITGRLSSDSLVVALGSWWERARAGHTVRLSIGGAGASSLVDAFTARVSDGDVVAVAARAGALPGAFVDELLRALDHPATVEATTAALRARVLHALVAPGRARPLLVVLHDLQLVDELSEVLLVQVLRALRDAPVLVLGTTSVEALGRRWRRLFAGGPDAQELLLGAPDLDAARDLEMAVRRLSAGARRLLGALAVLEGGADSGDRGVVQTVAETTSAEFVDAWAELVAAGLVDAQASGAAARQRRPRLRPAVDTVLEAVLAPTERRRLHRRAATAVAGGRAALAHRVAAADGPDPALAAELESAAQAEAADHREAAVQLLAAADLSEQPADAERRRLAAALRLVDAGDAERLKALESEVRSASSGPERNIVLGFLLSHEHRPEAVVRLRSAMEAPEVGREIGCLAGVRLALEHVFRGRGADAEDVAGGVLARTRDPLRAEQALFLRAIGRALCDGPAAGLAVLDGRLDGALTADLAVTAGTFLLAQGDPAAARQRLEEAVRRYRRGCCSVSVHRAHLYLAEALFHTGQWELATAEAETALQWFADGSRPWARAVGQAVAALVPAARGRTEEARVLLDAARRGVAGSDNPRASAAIALAEAVSARERADHETVLAATAGFAASARRGGLAAGTWAPWRALRIEALVATGDIAAARRLLAVAHGGRAPLGATLTAHRLTGLVERARGRHAGAEAAYRAGLSIADRHRVRVVETCRVELAELQAALADLPGVADVAELRAAARATFAELGAGARLARIPRSETDLGPVEGWPVVSATTRRLTSREREVAHLVAEGMTRREVAEALWVSTKAVDFHLGNVFAKLGITSRRELRGRTFR